MGNWVTPPIFWPFLFLLIQVSLWISTIPTSWKATKRTSPFTPVKIPREPFFKSSFRFHTSITLQPRFNCRTGVPGQHMLLDPWFSNRAWKVTKSPGNASSSRLLDNCTGTFRKKMRVASSWNAGGKALPRDKRYCSDELVHWPSLKSERAEINCRSSSDCRINFIKPKRCGMQRSNKGE